MHSNPTVHKHARQWKEDRESMEFVNPAWVMDGGDDMSREELQSVLPKVVVDKPMPGGYYAPHMFHNGPALELYLDHFPKHVNIRAEKVTETPLMTQATFGRVDCVKVLLKRGAYPFATDYIKRTALDYAGLGYNQSTKPIVINMIKESIADWNKKCHNCKKGAVKLSKCAGCKMVVYCGRDCQSSHWKSVHKFLCKTYPQLTITPEGEPPSGPEDCRIS